MDIILNSKLEHLAETKDLIKSALIEKGQTVEDTDTFRSYAEKVLAIGGGGAGGGSNVTVKSGSFNGTGAAMTVTHDCGKVPDVFLVFTTKSEKAYFLTNAIGFSRAFLDAFGGIGRHYRFQATYDPYTSASSSNAPIDEATSGYGLHSATETTIVVGSGTSSVPLSGATYYWKAIYGMT